jgi:hypothetical protein
MATSEDEWGRDPSVRLLRRVFSHIEREQNKLLDHLQISPLDSRLRPWREAALGFFEKAWDAADRQGLARDERSAALLYLEVLARTLRSNGIDVPAEWVPCDEEISRVLRENGS